MRLVELDKLSNIKGLAVNREELQFRDSDVYKM